MKSISGIIMTLFLIVSCQNNEKVADLYGVDILSSNMGSFEGCLDGESIDRQSVKIFFQIPEKASELKIFRDGQIISTLYPSTAGHDGEVVDQNLREGGLYKYTCHAKINGVYKRGTNELSLKPINTFAPIFSGINSVNLKTSSSAIVEWEPPTEDGPIAKHYKVYFNAGRFIDYKKAPLLVNEKLNLVIENLGDEIPYSFAVNACTINDICDKNTKYLTLETPDRGASTASGMMQLIPKSGRTLEVVAPWSDANGGIYKRRLIIVRGSEGESDENAMARVKNCSIENQSDGCQNVIFPFVDGIVNSNLEFPVEEGVVYFIRLVDEDKQKAILNRQDHSDIKKFMTQDLTPPVFSGILELVQPDPLKSSLKATFQAASDAEAVHLYTVMGSLNETLADPCSLNGEGIKIGRTNWKGDSALNYIEFETSDRVQVKVCLKGSDSAGNISLGKSFKFIKTKDKTAPLFDGISRIRYLIDEISGKSSIRLSWAEAFSGQSDVYQYDVKVNILREGSIREFNYKVNKDQLSLTLETEALQLENYDVVFAAVNVCDDALIQEVNATSNSANCTSYSIDQASAREGIHKTALGIIKPPVKFDGINGLESNSHGSILVKWGKYDLGKDFPETWAGFKVYALNKDSSKTLLKTIPCPNIGEDAQGRALYNCQGLQSASLSNLNPSQVFKILVKAYNSQGDSQDIRDENALMIKVKDEVAPLIQGNISQTLTNNILTLTWPAASDTQFAWQDYLQTLPNKISYLVKRNGVITQTLESTQLAIDLTKLSSGLHVFQVCPTDQAQNVSTNCLSLSYEIRDIIAPELKIALVKKISSQEGIQLELELKDETTSAAQLCTDLTIEGNFKTKAYDSTKGLCVITGLNSDVNKNLEKTVRMTVYDQARNSLQKDLTLKINREYTISSANWGDWDLVDSTKRYAIVIRGESILEKSEVYTAQNEKLVCDQPDQKKIICFSSSYSNKSSLVIRSGDSSKTLSTSANFANCAYGLNTDMSNTTTITICNSSDWAKLRIVDASNGNTKQNLQRYAENYSHVIVDIRNHILAGDFPQLLLPASSLYNNRKLTFSGNGYMLSGLIGSSLKDNQTYYHGLISEAPYNLEVKFQNLGIYKTGLNLNNYGPTGTTVTHIYSGLLAGVLRKSSVSTLTNSFSVQDVWIDSYRIFGASNLNYQGARFFGSLYGTQSGVDSSSYSVRNNVTQISNVQVSRLDIQLRDTTGGNGNTSQCSNSNITYCGAQLSSCALGCGFDLFKMENISLSGSIINSTMGTTTGGVMDVMMVPNTYLKNIESNLVIQGRKALGFMMSLSNGSSTTATLSNISIAGEIAATTINPSPDSLSYAAGLVGSFQLSGPILFQNLKMKSIISSRLGSMSGVFRSTGSSSSTVNGQTINLCTNVAAGASLPSITFSNLDLSNTFRWSYQNTSQVITSSFGRQDNITPIVIVNANFEDNHSSDSTNFNYLSTHNLNNCQAPEVSIQAAYLGAKNVGSWDGGRAMNLDQIFPASNLTTTYNGVLSTSTNWNALDVSTWINNAVSRPYLKSNLAREGLINIQ
jgi:hypothetical protein